MEMLKDITESTIYKRVSYEFNSKVLRILTTLDNQVTKNLVNGHIATRPAKTNGLWCCILLPAVLVLYSTLYQVCELYTLLANISIGLLAYSILFIIFMSVSCLVLKDNAYGGCGAASLVATLFVYGVQGEGLIFSLVYSTAAVHAYSTLLKIALIKCPKTFTIGEAMVVTQSIVLFGTLVISEICFNMTKEEDEEMIYIKAIIFAILSSVGIIVTALFILEESQKTIPSLLYITGAAGTYALIILHLLFGSTCIMTVVLSILTNTNKITLILFWLCLVGVAVIVILMRTQDNVKANTVMRKAFHVLASLVFLSGIVLDVTLMKFAAGVGFALVILVEALRKSDIEKVSPALQAAFEVYSDEKDAGSFAMTPIYLYVGLACPLLLVPVHPGYEVELLSGVLSIGIGDTAASWIGSNYGHTKIAGGDKTIEGTAANILSQVLVMFLLWFFNILSVPHGVIRVAVAATISGLVEAKTNQVDNLILPLVTLIAFQVTSLL